MTTVAPSEQATATATATADEILRRLLTTEEGRRDPYPLYRALRDTAPFYRSGLDGCWYASGYDHCKAVLVDPRAGRSAGQMAARLGQNPEMMQRFARRSRHTMLFQNPPEHTRLRGLVSRAFTPKRMAALASGIASLTEPLLDEMAAAGEVDVMAALAFPLPVAVIGALVGVPPDEREQFRPLTRAIMALSEPDAPAESLAAADRAAEYQDAYFSDLIARRRARPTDDLLSALVGLRDAGGPLSEDEMLATVRLLFGAGFVTTSNLIGNGLLTLLRHPGEKARLWADPTLVVTAVEEMLRYESPIQVNGRTILAPTQVAGVELAPGESVVTLVGGANRDPARFADPERFDVGRKGEAPLSFGWGIHHCLGAALARLEGQIVFAALARRFASLDLDGPEPPLRTTFLRGVEELPVVARPR